MGFRLESVDNRCLVRLPDAVTVNCATELHRTLVEALASAGPVEIDLENVTEVDVSAIQVLDAAARAARSDGKSFTASVTVPETISHAFRLCGLDPFAQPPMTAAENE